MTEFNPNCGRCGMLNSRGFCSLTACRFPSNVIVVEPKVIRGMMVNPQIEKPQTNADRIRAMTDEKLAEFIGGDPMHDICPNNCHEDLDRLCKVCVLDWLRQEAGDAL